MGAVRLNHFQRAAAEIGTNGDNDTLPFDCDTSFVNEKQVELANLAFHFCQSLEKSDSKDAAKKINQLAVFSERLLVASGQTGFRITTKIHPFWTVYFNGLGVAIAEKNEGLRDERAHSYRFSPSGKSLFDPLRSWRAFREATIAECKQLSGESVVVQTDVSSFYDYVYHHRLENCLSDLFPTSTLPVQVDRLLNKFSSGRSFGLPVGGQCSRILAECLMNSIDQQLTGFNLRWHRYVDDFVIMATDNQSAYSALAKLSHTLADYGLTLNKSKTVLLSHRHYIDYANAQLHGPVDTARVLREIDLRFDPYTDSPVDDYESLKSTVQNLNLNELLQSELAKSQPDNFLVTQIGRTLRLNNPDVALQLCSTFLSAENLHAFRGSWSTIMRGISGVRGDCVFESIFDQIDARLDQLPSHSPHLLEADAGCLHFLRAIRFMRTSTRAK